VAIPNTTPTPNELFNGEMKKMSDAELRVVMIVTRATFGWIIDKKTGLRKEEDWISHSQMVKKSGKSSRAIKYAVQECINKGWIEVRGKDGELLDTGEKRQKYGRKLYYRLGYRLLGRVKRETSAGNAHVNKPVQITTRTSANNDTKPVQTMHRTKESITKEIITKDRKHKKYSSIRDIKPLDLQEIADRYKVSVGFVGLQFEKLKNYCESRGRRYKNYKSALRNFVLSSMQRSIEERRDNRYRAVDARNVK